MVELNRKHNLSTIPSIDNDGNAYVIPLDIYKEGYQAYDISNWFKGRVGDNGTPFAIRWYSHGRLLNILGKRPFIEGQVGDYTIDDSDPDNPQITMAEDAANIHIVGDVTDTQEGGIAIYRLISQAFPKSGIFYGKIGFMGVEDDGTLVNTGVDIVFKVLAGHMNMLGARQFYVSELEKAWLDLQEKIRQYDQQYKDQTQQQADQFKQDTEKALADLNTKIANEIKRAEDTLGDTQASIDSNIASLKTLATQIASLQAKLQDEDLITIKQYENEKEVTEQLVKEQIRDWNVPSQVFADSNAIAAKYPNGGDYGRLMVITKNDGHRWIYDDTKQWVDVGPYQTAEIAQGSITSDKISNYSTAKNVIQKFPWIFDATTRILEVTPDSYFVKDNKLITLPSGKYKMPPANLNADAPYNFFIIYDPDANTIVGNYQFEIKSNQYFLGYINYDQPSDVGVSSPFKIITPSQVPTHSNYTADLLNEWNVPQSKTSFFVTGDDFQVDFLNQNLMLKKSISFSFKQQNWAIEPQKLDLSDAFSKGNVVYIFGILDNDNPYKVKLVVKSSLFNSATLDIPYSIYIGWIDNSTYRYSFFSVDNGSGLSVRKPNFLYTGKISVDFDKKIIHIPQAVHTYSNKWGDDHNIEIPATALPLKNIDDKDDVEDGGHLGIIIDENNNYKYVVTAYYQKLVASGYYLGWYLTASRTYDFGQYGQSSDLASMPWINKQVTCLGDSITSGGGTNDPAKAQSYVPELTNIIGTTATNAGVSGSLITSGIPDKPKSFAERVDDIKDQDIVTIFGGTNDFWFGAPLGKMGDTETTTFYGALEFVIKELMKNNPIAKFMIITPMKINPKGWDTDTPTYNADGSLNKNSAGLTELDYIKAMKDLGLKYSIPVLDMFAKSNYNPQLAQYVGADSFSVEGIHPNIHGARRLAQTIGHAINEL